MRYDLFCKQCGQVAGFSCESETYLAEVWAKKGAMARSAPAEKMLEQGAMCVGLEARIPSGFLSWCVCHQDHEVVITNTDEES